MRTAQRAGFIVLALTAGLAGTAHAQAHAPAAAHAQPQAHSPAHAHEWSYEGALGPTHWGSLKPEYATCGTGHEQSPIDITSTTVTTLDSIHFDYHAFPLHIVDNGHTVQVNAAPGSAITVGGHRYELRQFHFHHPSEEHVHGHGFDMVAHLVHADSAGHLAVVAVLLTSGAAQPLIQTLWDHLPHEQGHEDAVAGTMINAAQLLPADRGYYTFAGSLTTPPCTEHVTWFVLKHPMELSTAQVATFGHRYPNDARPTQPVNGRVVKETR
jgi:carbonic anhydrase